MYIYIMLAQVGKEANAVSHLKWLLPSDLL